MTDVKPNTPRLRFPGFTDPWEQRRLGELYEKNSERNSCGFGADRTLSVATMTFNEGGNGADESSLPGYKVIRIGDVAFEGHANKEFAYGRFVVNDLADGIMSPRFSCLRPTHDYPVSFWKYCLHNERMMRDILIRATKKGTMMNELVFDELFGQSISVPSEPEQRAIGALFRDLDSLITLHQRELDHLKLQKRGLLQKMFPKEGSNVPELRFPGFTDPWEQRRLGEIYEPGDKKNSDLGIGFDRTISVASMSWKPSGNGASAESLPSYKVLELGDLAFEGNRTKGHPYGKLVINDIGAGIMSSRFRTLSAKREVCVPFWKQFLSVDAVFRRILIRSTKRGTLMTELVVPDLLESSIPVPGMSEQRAIGVLFRDLDSLITLHQRELDHLKLQKKALLQQMFV